MHTSCSGVEDAWRCKSESDSVQAEVSAARERVKAAEERAERWQREAQASIAKYGTVDQAHHTAVLQVRARVCV
jgi:hypothetical protein